MRHGGHRSLMPQRLLQPRRPSSTLRLRVASSRYRCQTHQLPTGTHGTAPSPGHSPSRQAHTCAMMLQRSLRGVSITRHLHGFTAFLHVSCANARMNGRPSPVTDAEPYFAQPANLTVHTVSADLRPVFVDSVQSSTIAPDTQATDSRLRLVPQCNQARPT